MSGLVSVIIGGAFALLVLAINDLSDSTERVTGSIQVLAAGEELKTLLVDIETGERGFVITGETGFLQPWNSGRASFAGKAAAFQRLAAISGHGQGARAHAISYNAATYIRDYSIPTVNTATRDLASAQTVAVTEDGKRRMDGLRERFSRFGAIERSLLAKRQARADTDAKRATAAAATGVAGSMVLILASGGYVTRAVVRPVRGASLMAGRLADGDLSVRMPETGPAEIGHLERSFNTMAGSLEASRDELRRVAHEQAALRRVATLVARGASPPTVFSAVAAEMGSILSVVCTAVVRYEVGAEATVVGAWCLPSGAELRLPVGSHWPLEPDGVLELVLRTGRTGRRAIRADAATPISAWAGGHGIRSSVAAPVHVEGHLWGVVIAFGAGSELESEGIEERMGDFTELVATAIANAESRAELAASRARVVAASDETRRRIERDLHDGTQQRLISLGLELRAAELDVPPEHDRLREQLSHAVRGLGDVVEELQELSRGLHPAILSQGGLGPALRGLARRSRVPVELTMVVGRRLPERAEVAAYYVVSEALTNVAKHARASHVRAEVTVDGDTLRLWIRDDGVGGADPARGSGLIGLRDRVEAVGGRIQIVSPHGGGTSLRVTIPAGS